MGTLALAMFALTAAALLGLILVVTLRAAAVYGILPALAIPFLLLVLLNTLGF